MKKLAESVIYNDEDVVISTDILDRLAEDEEVKDICIKRMKQLKMNDEIEGLEHGGVKYKKGYLQLKVFIGNVLEQVISEHRDKLMAETKENFIDMVSNAVEEYEKAHKNHKNHFILCVSSFIIIFICQVFTPTTKEALIIYGVGGTIDYVKSNKIVKELPDKCIKAADKFLNDYIGE